MARPLRVSFPGAVYHVTARGNERRAIVDDDEDRQRFVRTLAATVEQYELVCHAWVLMTNHYHLVVETPLANISSAVQHLNGVYSQGYNRRHQRVGHLFQGRFSGILVDREGYLLEVCRYVVLNPVRAGLVALPGDWPWSSYRATVGSAPCPPWLAVAPLLAHFGTRRATARSSYARFVADGMARSQPLWSEMQARGVIGSERFVAAVTERIGQVEDRELVLPVPRASSAVPSADMVLREVADAYGVPLTRLLRPNMRRHEARLVAMYALRRVAQLSLAAVGARAGVRGPTVSKAVHQVLHRMAEDRTFAFRVAAILGKWKGLTPVENGKT